MMISMVTVMGGYRFNSSASEMIALFAQENQLALPSEGTTYAGIAGITGFTLQLVPK